MADAPVIPIQTCKLPTPRELTLNETRESLCTWLNGATNFFSRDDNFARFLEPQQTWDRDEPNYGFANEGNDTRLRRQAAQVSAALLRFFSAVSGFFPFTFLERRFPDSTSWASMRDIILNVYNVALNGASLLQYSDITRSSEENHYIFFERLQDFFRQHLVAPGVNVGGYNTGPDGDQFNLSMVNMIVMMLCKC